MKYALGWRDCQPVKTNWLEAVVYILVGIGFWTLVSALALGVIKI